MSHAALRIRVYLPLCLCALIISFGIFYKSFAIADEEPVSEKSSDPASDYLLYPLKFFRQYISGADGDRCPMYPTCSTYGLEAFKTHGFVKGWIMTCDRLMRCGRDELNLSPIIHINEEIRCYDPIDQNYFWRQ